MSLTKQDMPSLMSIVLLVVLVRHGLGAVTPMHRMTMVVGTPADVARLNCHGFPTDLLPTNRQLTPADLVTARDAALAILAARVGVPILPMMNETLPAEAGQVESANRGLCDVNILLWFLPWPLCRVQSPPPRPAPIDAVREEVQRCY